MTPTLMKLGWFLLLIGPLITVHELGHFLVAKLFRVKVLRFSIGFGPKLFGFTRGETEYQLAALPLGGYVKMAGDDPTENPRPEDRGRGFLEQAPWKRSLIALAGPLMNLVVPIGIYFCIYDFQSQDLSSLVGHVSRDSAAYKAGIRDGDRILSIDGRTVHYFDELRDLIGPKAEQQVSVEIEHPDGTRVTLQATPQKGAEPGVLHDATRGVLGVSSQARASIVNVLGPDTPAGKAGLRPLDRITAVAGKPVKSFVELQRSIAAQTGPFDIQFVRAEPLDTPGVALSTQVVRTARLEPTAGADLAARTGIAEAETLIGEVEPGSPAAAAGLQPGDEIVSVDGKPVPEWSTVDRARTEAKLAPMKLQIRRFGKALELTATQVNRVQENERGKDITVAYFGAQPAFEDVVGERIPIHRGAWTSLALAAQVVPKTIGQVVEGFVGLLTYQVSPKTVGSVFMLADIATKTAEAGWDAFLTAMAFVSVNLGVMNLLPIPVLDGFQILSSGVEAVRRRPLTLRAREIANMVGLAMLLLLMAYVLHNDVRNYLIK